MSDQEQATAGVGRMVDEGEARIRSAIDDLRGVFGEFVTLTASGTEAERSTKVANAATAILETALVDLHRLAKAAERQADAAEAMLEHERIIHPINDGR